MNDHAARLLFFLHIPKNSGTTLNQIIRKNYSRIFKISWDHANPRHAGRLLDAGNRSVFSGYQVVSGHFPYGLHRLAADGESFAYMTMLREPIRRCLSTYNYLRRDSKYINANPGLTACLAGMTLASFFERHQPDIPNHIYIDNCQVRYLSGVGDSKAFGDMSRDDLEIAKQHLAAMTFGITEEFNRSMLLCREVFGWRTINYTSARVGSGAKQIPTASEAGILRERNALDLDIYEYAVDLFRQRTAEITAAQLDAYRSDLAWHARIQRLTGMPRAMLRGVGKWF